MELILRKPNGSPYFLFGLEVVISLIIRKSEKNLDFTYYLKGKPRMNEKVIVIGSDDAGLELKSIIIELLHAKAYIVEDLGISDNTDKTMYPLISKRVCERIIESRYTKQGILICGTGIGMALVANKFPGIFAAVCHDPYSAERSKRSNDCNLLCMGARVIGTELARKLTIEWLSYDEVDEKSKPKVAAIMEIDKETRKQIY